MSPHRERRPNENEGAVPKSAATTTIRSLQPVAEQTPNVEPRKGRVLRVTTSRTVSCGCADCDLITDNTGAAASHARAARHWVDCTYAATFALVPVETVASC